MEQLPTYDKLITFGFIKFVACRSCPCPALFKGLCFEKGRAMIKKMQSANKTKN